MVHFLSEEEPKKRRPRAVHIKTGTLTLGQTIAMYRLAGNQSQEELGDRVGLSARMISELERDNYSALKHLGAIEEALDLAPGTIFGRADPYSQVLHMADVLEEIRLDLKDVLRRLGD